MAAVLAHVPQAQAQNLSHFISNLYGGQGITLADTPPPFPSHSHHFSEASIEQLNSLSTSLVSSLNLTTFPTAVANYTYDISTGFAGSHNRELGTDNSGKSRDARGWKTKFGSNGVARKFCTI
jgi:hypothetical protein